MGDLLTKKSPALRGAHRSLEVGRLSRPGGLKTYSPNSLAILDRSSSNPFLTALSPVFGFSFFAWSCLTLTCILDDVYSPCFLSVPPALSTTFTFSILYKQKTCITFHLFRSIYLKRNNQVLCEADKSYLPQ